MREKSFRIFKQKHPFLPKILYYRKRQLPDILLDYPDLRPAGYPANSVSRASPSKKHVNKGENAEYIIVLFLTYYFIWDNFVPNLFYLNIIMILLKCLIIFKDIYQKYTYLIRIIIFINEYYFLRYIYLYTLDYYYDILSFIFLN